VEKQIQTLFSLKNYGKVFIVQFIVQFIEKQN